MSAFVDMSGMRFGKLLVLWPAGYGDRRRRVYWACQCDDGNTTVVGRDNLISGRTRSCGCYQKSHRFIHGQAANGSKSPEYAAFHEAKRRCTDKKFKHFKYYGGRGIEFRFLDFAQFLKELGLRPSPEYSVDRINNDGHYEPGNVRWATSFQQAHNRRPQQRKSA